jgi:hypothetical protein
MKRGLVHGVAALAIAIFAAPLANAADPTPTPSPTISRTPQEQYKFDKDNYLAAVKARDIAMRAINQIFKAAIDKSTRDYRAAMAVAKTSDQKFQASTARTNAITAAIATRDAAIAALGAAPIEPVEPLKMSRMKLPKDGGKKNN